MDSGHIDDAVKAMRKRRFRLAKGLTDSEVAAVEARFEFLFPPDLRMFLQTAMPVSAPKPQRVQTEIVAQFGRFPRFRRRKTYWGFPNWRDGSKDNVAAIRYVLSTPVDNVLFDVEKNAQWVEEWGERPDDTAEAVALARAQLAIAPTLVPYNSMDYIASTGDEGNPVYELVLNDINYKTFDLAGFLCGYGLPIPPWVRTVPRWIPQWTILASMHTFDADTPELARLRHEAFTTYSESLDARGKGFFLFEFYSRFGEDAPSYPGWWPPVRAVQSASEPVSFITCIDPATLVPFYEALLGWPASQEPPPPWEEASEMWVLRSPDGSRQARVLAPLSPEDALERKTIYIEVESLEDALRLVVANGGTFEGEVASASPGGPTTYRARDPVGHVLILRLRHSPP